MNPIGAVLTIILVFVVLSPSRKVAALGMLAGMMFLTQNQQLKIAGFNLFAIRILGVVVFFRVLARGEFSFGRMNVIDKLFLWLYTFTTIVYCIRSSEGQAYEIATGLDAIFAYYACRGLIQDMEDLKAILRGFVPMLVIYAGMVVFESVTHKNPFAAIGGVNFGWIRNGRLRCFGSFRNPDILGTLGATFLPLYIGLGWAKEDRKRAIIAGIACLVVIVACNSGGPMSAAAFGVIGWAFWKIKHRMQTVRRGLAGFIMLAALLMKAPVWYLIARVSQITGGDGWHRSYLLDITFQHFSMWWFMGLNVIETSDWFPYTLVTTGGADITNVFIAFGLQAGMGAMILLIWKLVKCFGAVGGALRVLQAHYDWVTHDEFMVWGLGVMLASHIINWFGITYFDQSYIMWDMQLAALSSITYHIMNNPPEKEDDSGFQLEKTEGSDREFVFEPLN